MDCVLFAGFRGKSNASGILAEQLSPEPLLLTNSFAGLRADIESVRREYDCVILFGVDKTLDSSVRIEKSAVMDGERKESVLDLEKLSESFNATGIPAVISDDPVPCLCNAAYRHALEKFSRRAVFIHMPTIRHADGRFMEKIKSSVLTLSKL